MLQGLKDAGITEKDIPGAIVAFNALLWVEWGAVLLFCCNARPLRRLMEKPLGVKLRQGLIDASYRRYPKFEKWVIEKAVSTSESRFFRPIPRFFHQSPKVTN